MTAATTLRDQGISDTLAADTAPHRCYAQLVREAVTAMSGEYVDAETIRAWIAHRYPDAQPHHQNVLSGAIQRLAASGALTPAGWVDSTRATSRGRPLRLWRAT